ncbi:MAG: serine hydrolase domain-containing protein [Pyrinomonadaceae bacterium]
MNGDKRNAPIETLLAEHIAARDFPSAVYMVAEGNHIVFEGAMGNAVREPETRVAKIETIYDLASLTKPLITTLLCALRIEQTELSLDERVALHLAEFDTHDKRAITLRQLLTHTSGLPAWRPLAVLAKGERRRVLSIIANAPLEAAPGTLVRYSDLGFITLGFLLERLTGASLAEIARAEIFAPLKLHHTFFNPPATLRDEIAASETGNFYERAMAEAETAATTNESQSWREHSIWGEVHDGNAYFLGGAAGHAGLFSNARETFRIAQQFLASQTILLAPETCALFRTNMTEGMEEARSMGWQLAATKDSTAGQDLSPDSFGHLGFTGTSCWIDPTRGRTFILLTNRTHAHALPFVNINGVRRRFHSLATAALDEHKERQNAT